MDVSECVGSWGREQSKPSPLWAGAARSRCEELPAERNWGLVPGYFSARGVSIFLVALY